METAKYGIFHLVVRSGVQYFSVSKGWAALEQGVAILFALTWTAAIIATQHLFDAATAAVSGGLEFWDIARPVIVLGAIVVAQQLLSSANYYLFTFVSYGNSGKFMAEFQRKLGRLPAANFEDPDFLDEVEMAQECLEYEALGSFTATCIQLVTYYLVFFVSVGIFLFRLSPLLPLVIIAAFVPALFALFAEARIFLELEEENAPLRRRFKSYQDAIAAREFFKETRLLGGFQYFHRLFSQTLALITQNTWRTERKAFLFQLALNLISFIGLGVSIWLLFNATMQGNISVGAFAAVFAGLTQIFRLMSEVILGRLSEASEVVGQIENYYRLMDLPEVGGNQAKRTDHASQTNQAPDFSQGVVAENVSFAYPGRDKAAVNNVSLTIKDGETIAIVGENGAGKSTLVRLLIGLYPPDSGTVAIGGLDTKETHPDVLYQNTSGVFQRYQRYKMTLAENVGISNTAQPANAAKVNVALKEAKFNEPKADLDTMLSPEFNGIDLSGGQWQRLAIARGLYRTNQFIVLDEPTAAIDPIEESRIFRQFEQLAEGKSAIVVTHRLGSAKLADRIVVMDNGEIVDIGTHDELLNRKGKYQEMWHAQSRWYENRT